MPDSAGPSHTPLGPANHSTAMHLTTPQARRATARPQLLISALAYAVASWPVLPLHTPSESGRCSCRRPDCPSPGKHPRTRRGLHDATTHVDTIRGWWARWPDANLGIRTGSLVVVDIDGPAGTRSLAELEARHGPLPLTRTAGSGRGRHLYFQAADHTVFSSAGRLGPGLDVRGHGAYITAPPSRHATGYRYAWITSGEPVEVPDWLVARLAETGPAPRLVPAPDVSCIGGGRAERYMQAALSAELGELAGAVKDTRNTTLNRVAFCLGQLIGAGLGDPDRVAEALLDQALAIGLGEREARATIASGLRAGQCHPRTIGHPRP